MKRLHKLLYLVLSILLSCSQYSYKDSYKLLKGMSTVQVRETTNSGPVNEFEVTTLENVSRTYFVQIYKEYRGFYVNYLVVVYRDNKLFYWGYPYEFNRSFDNDMNVIGKKVTKKLFRDAED